MKMDMVDGLPACLVTIHNHSISFVCNTLSLSQFRCHEKQLSYYFPVLWLQVVDCSYLLLGNYQNMKRGLWIDVSERKDVICFINDVSRYFAIDNLHKQIVGHVDLLVKYLPQVWNKNSWNRKNRVANEISLSKMVACNVTGNTN